MRTVYAKVEATILIPVRVRLDIAVDANYNASIAKAVQSWATGKRYDKANVDSLDLDHVYEVGSMDATNQHDVGSTFEDALSEEIEMGGTEKTPVKIHKITVTASSSH